VIYADNAATTKIPDTVLEKMLPFLQGEYGNASSQHSFGVKARRAITQARRQVAEALGAEETEIFFTSGGTEANNWVIRAIANAYRGKPTHMVTSEIEHHSVLDTCRALERSGVEITYVPVNEKGMVDLTALENVIKPHTRLVSIMLANNEIGTVQPVDAIGKLLRNRGVLFHTDAVQAVGHIPVDLSRLPVDFLTASAHKFNGAKGAGILYKRAEIELAPLLTGGEQERGLRAGTENVAGVVSAGYALEESFGVMDSEAKRLRKMVEDTVDGIKAKIPTVWVNGDSNPRLPGLINLGFEGVSGEALMNVLSLKGVCVSTGAACVSGKHAPSHVLLALGLSEQRAQSAIRISYGRYNTPDEVERVVAAVCEAYYKILHA